MTDAHPALHDKPEFTVGQVVWAKLDGFPWWPARIADLATEAHAAQLESLQPKPDHQLVYFFGDHNYAFLKNAKIQLFTEKYSERVANAKIKNFKAALHECQAWAKGGSSVEPYHERTNSPLPPPSPSDPASPIIQTPARVSTASHPTTTPHTTTHTTSTIPYTKRRSPSPPPANNHFNELPEQPIVDIPLSSELAKVWNSVEVDEDTIDGFIVISSEQDMVPVVSFYNEQKRKLSLQLAQTSSKRLKTDSPFIHQKAPPKVEPHLTSTSSATATTPFYHTILPPSIPTASIPTAPIPTAPISNTPIPTPSIPSASVPITPIPPTSIPTPAQSASARPMHFTPPAFSTPAQTIALSAPTYPALAQRGPIIRKFAGTATNGFSAAPIRGNVEGGDDGLHVEFTVQGHTYRGFLLARDSLPAIVSPLVPPVAMPYPGFPIYGNVAKMTAMAVTKQHHERLVDLGRLVVASAMVPYTYPPPLHL